MALGVKSSSQRFVLFFQFSSVDIVATTAVLLLAGVGDVAVAVEMDQFRVVVSHMSFGWIQQASNGIVVINQLCLVCEINVKCRFVRCGIENVMSVGSVAVVQDNLHAEFEVVSNPLYQHGAIGF